MSKVAKRKPRNLVSQRLEKVSKEVFKKYASQITDLIGNSPGVYALYDGNDLYYVGKSIDLKKRVNRHLKDRHLASWTHFSLYLVRNEEHIHEIESLIVRISNPKGNRVVPKGKSRGELFDQLKKMVQQKQKEELQQMFGGRSAKKKKGVGGRIKKSLDGLVPKRTLLFRSYKGKEYKAHLLKNGTIKYLNKSYGSPSAVAKKVVGRASNGWMFWYIKDENGDWIKLNQFAGYE